MNRRSKTTLSRKNNSRNTPRRQNVVGTLIGTLGPSRASHLSSPPEVQDTIRLTKRIQIKLTAFPGGTGLSPAILSAGVPGGLTYWSRMRIERLDFWSNSSSTGTDTITVIVPPGATSGTPPAQWTDTGVYGQRRAHVGFKFGLAERQCWHSTADEKTLCNVRTDVTPSTPIIIQATVELMSTPLV